MVIKIGAEDGIIVSWVEDYTPFFLDKVQEFSERTEGLFCGKYKGKSKIAVRAEDMQSRESIEKELEIIKRLCRLTGYRWLYVDIERSFYERLNQLYEALAVITEPERLERERLLEEERKLEKWQSKCKDGCGYCRYLRRNGDDHFCAYSGDLLEDKNVPKYIRGVHYMFNYEAFPNGNCAYKISEIQGE